MVVTRNTFETELFYPEVGRIVFDIPGGSVVKNLPTSAGDNRSGFDPWSGRSPTPVFLPGKFHGQRSLAGYSP